MVTPPKRILSNKETITGSTGWEIYAGTSNTKVYFRGSGSTPRSKDAVSSWAASNWHHVNAGFQRNGNLSLQVDGVNITLLKTVDRIVSSTRDLSIRQ